MAQCRDGRGTELSKGAVWRRKENCNYCALSYVASENIQNLYTRTYASDETLLPPSQEIKCNNYLSELLLEYLYQTLNNNKNMFCKKIVQLLLKGKKFF
jgi:hypothetical protein